MVRGIIQATSFKANSDFDVNAFNQMLEDAYMSTARPNGRKQKKSFAPSGLGYGSGRCPRYWFLAFTGSDFVETTDSQGIANMAVGVDGHARLQAILERTPVHKQTELEVTYTDPPIRGFIDVIINWQGKDIVGEIKTVNQEGFAIRKATNKPIGGHLLQVLIYMHILGLDQGFLLYENKNTQELWTIPVTMTPRNAELIRQAFDWMRSVYKLWENNELPARPFTKSTPECKSCPVFDTCWSMENGIVKLEPLGVVKP